MALTPRIKSAIFFTSGFILFTVSAIVYTIYNHKTHYQYGVLIDSGNPNITISLYRWPVDRYNKTGLAELAETCISNDLTEYLANSSDLSPVFQPCLSRVIGSLDNDEPTSTSSASQLFFTVSGPLFLLNMTSHQEVSSLVDSVSAYLSNNTKLNVQPVTFIDDENGAIYPWIAVNSLEARTHSESIGSPKHSGVIEISYTESSISLEVKNTSLIPPEQVNSLVDISLFGKNHSLYGKKYSCFGSDKGRLRYITELIVDSRESTLGDPCLPIGVNQTINTQDLIQMRDPCLHTSKSMELNKEYTLMGKGDGQTCSKMISDLLDKSKCEDNPATCYKSPSIAPDDVVYTAVADLLYPVTVLKLPANHSIDENDYFNQSISLCGMSRDDLLITSGGKLAPTSLCFQLLYNYHIIQDVFGLKGNWSKIVFDPSLRGDSTINWSTGFMINATSSIPNLTAPKHWISTICCIVLITIAAAYLVCGFYFLIVSLRAQRVPNKEIYQPIQQQPQP